MEDIVYRTGQILADNPGYLAATAGAVVSTVPAYAVHRILESKARTSTKAELEERLEEDSGFDPFKMLDGYYAARERERRSREEEMIADVEPEYVPADD